MKGFKVVVFLLFFFMATPLQVVWPSDEKVPVITIKNHSFSPEELNIPSGKKVKILVKNEDATPEEFESYDLNREKVVSAHAEITLFLGPLKVGRYHYFGDFHPGTAKGEIVAGPTEENN